jgi:hypothetical protein
MGSQRIGQWIDERTNFQQKAYHFAEEATISYLNANLDETAKEMLQQFGREHSITRFYRKFFEKHAIVFDSGSPESFNCINASACTVSLIRQLS